MPIVSDNGNKYIMTFIYDYVRMCWVNLLKSKPQYFETFNNFHVWIQNETQLQIGSLHTNRPQFHTILSKMVWQKE